MRPESEWIKIPTPPIIETELFMRAQERLKANYVLARRNRKNEYLLSGKIRCICGRTRAGEGPQHGKHLYYRCSDRVLSYPLPPTCKERGVNARIADALVWDQVAKLMSSKELMLRQVERWTARHKERSEGSSVEIATIQRELIKLKKQEDRYAKAYAEGLFSMEKLQDYITPMRAKIASFEGQIPRAQTTGDAGSVVPRYEPHEIEVFAERSAHALQNLNFEQKRGIVLNVVDKVIATQEMVEVHGFIPIDHVEFQTSNRDGASAIRHGRFMKSIPFEFSIPLPPPLKRGVDYGFLPGTNISANGRGRSTT
jgi:site-specific DNA recombinase